MKKILFIDRDGTIIQEPADEQIDAFEKLKFVPGAIRNLIFLRQHSDYEFVMVSNQDGLGTDAFPEETFWPIQNFILDTLKTLGLKNEIQLDLTLARGLNYYTGAIFEVKALDVQIGSITGGGRYDNLTGIFGMPGISGVGISFGVDRIFDVLNALDCYPKDAVNGTQLLFINFGEKESTYCLPFVAKAREAGIRTEIFPDSSKMKKQMSYANSKQIPFVALAGENEMSEGKLTLKNMSTGEQQLISIEELIEIVR